MTNPGGQGTSALKAAWRAIASWLKQAENWRFILEIALVSLGIWFAYLATPEQSFLRNLRIKGEGISVGRILLNPEYALKDTRGGFSDNFPIEVELFDYGDSNVVMSHIAVESTSPLCPVENRIVYGADKNQLYSQPKKKIVELRSGRLETVKANGVLIISGLMSFIETKRIDRGLYFFENYKGEDNYIFGDNSTVDQVIEWLVQKCGVNMALKIKFFTYGDRVFKTSYIKMLDSVDLSPNKGGAIQIGSLLAEIAQKRDLDGSRNILNMGKTTPPPPSGR